MRKVLLGLTVAVILALTSVPQAHASAFLRIAVGGAPTISCDNSTDAGVTACTAAGFVTSLGASGANAITFTGSINGVQFGNIFLSSNNPGSPATAFVLDTKFDMRNNSGAARTVTVDFAVNNFTQPVGPVFLSASQTANWTISTAGDTQTFQAWERNTNDLVVPGPITATAITTPCVSPGGVTAPCGQRSPDASISVTAPFALTGREVITMAAGTVGTYSGTSALNSTPQVPEPSSVLLLGTGVLLLAGRRWRTRKN